MKNCHVCNQLCEDDVELCPICGAMLLESENTKVSENSESEKKIEPVLLARFEDLVSADIFKDVLTDNSIPYSEPEGETMRVVFGGTFATVEIYVDKTDYDKALELYNEFMESGTDFLDEDSFI